MNTLMRSAVAAATLALAAQAGAQVTFYENDDFSGRSFTTQRQVANFNNFGFNDRASSVDVTRNRWEVCDDVRFSGRCVVLRPGRYPSLSAMGLNDRVSSVRILAASAVVDDDRYAPVAAPDFGRRGNERLFEAPVTSVRAVLGTPERRCWVEREQVSQGRESNNVPGAIAGALLGGILGHQVGGGTGRDVATVGGVVAGAAVGSRAGRDGGGGTVTQNVQRCENVSSNDRPDYWDVSYTFRGQPHRVQMSRPPGSTVTVNRQGEPRG
ncbi:beta/gamma crystallin-related protein [Ideonella sp. A 288]|uniref:beta/gamma crystallin-related protein n=1 Tax=Ideonella sp. A 288 TaxID=1962181 RepID=UPI000B4BBE12|nr:beta/gamma crystallin-related protein [Ideonella sp. A 288]